jgi:hypothetical protein
MDGKRPELTRKSVVLRKLCAFAKPCPCVLVGSIVTLPRLNFDREGAVTYCLMKNSFARTERVLWSFLFCLQHYEEQLLVVNM